MTEDRMITILDVNCEGEIGNVVLGEQIHVPGQEMAARLAYLNDTPAGRKLVAHVCHENGRAIEGSLNIVTPAVDPRADAGFLILQPTGAYAMSGSNAICVVTALLETGAVPMVEPETSITLDTAVGLIVATARCVEGKCVDVTLEMVPSFSEQLDLEVDYDGIPLKADIAFGGVYYAIVDVAQLGLVIEAGNERALYVTGLKLLDIIQKKCVVQHPERPELNTIAYLMFRRISGDVVQTCTILEPGRCDRSPCGTGSSANLAVMYEKGLATVNQTFVSRSISGSQFKVCFQGLADVAGRNAIIPHITGRAWVSGTHSLPIKFD